MNHIHMKKFISGLFLLASTVSFAQEGNEQIANKGLYNKLEFFINSQQTDSIFNLASPTFQHEVPMEKLSTFLKKDIFPLGRITNSTFEKFENGVATYALDFGRNGMNLMLSVDDHLKYQTLLFLPRQQALPLKEVPQKATIKSADIQSPQDFYIDSVANIYAKKGHTQSLAIGVINKGSIKSYFYGETEKGNGALPQGSTLYEIGSLTKIFTAILLADLVEKQVISLDDSIIKFLPDSLKSNPALQQITFKKLANHSSGLERMPNNFEQVKGYQALDPYKTYGRKELYEELKKLQINSEQIDQYNYSNLGYALLGDLIQTISKKSYEQQLKEVLTAPLGLTKTSITVDPKTTPMIKTYNQQGLETPIWNFQSFAAAGAIKSTMDDLLIFAKSQFKMPESTLENAMALTRQFTFFLPPDTDIGLAWHINMIDDMIYFHHTGGTYGSSSYIAISPDAKTAVIVLSNAAESVEPTGSQIIKKILTP